MLLKVNLQTIRKNLVFLQVFEKGINKNLEKTVIVLLLHGQSGNFPCVFEGFEKSLFGKRWKTLCFSAFLKGNIQKPFKNLMFLKVFEAFWKWWQRRLKFDTRTGTRNHQKWKSTLFRSDFSPEQVFYTLTNSLFDYFHHLFDYNTKKVLKTSFFDPNKAYNGLDFHMFGG